MEIAKIVVEYLQVLTWPLIVVFLIIRFRPNIEDLLAKLSERFGSAEKVTLGVLGQQIEISGTAATPSPLALPRSQVSQVAYRVAIVNESSILTDEQVNSATIALQTQVHRDFAPVWGIDADITFVPADSKPAADSWWMVILDYSDLAGVLAYRDLTPAGLPLAKVFAKSALESQFPWTMNASHVLLEMLANPRTNLTVFAQAANGRTGKLYSYEICNPCEDQKFGYDINGIRVSDFVFPAWFEPFRGPKSTQFDYCMHITRPFELLQGGYANVIDVTASTGWHSVFETKDRDATGRRRKSTG